MSTKSSIALKVAPSVKSAITSAIKRESTHAGRTTSIRRILGKLMPAEQAKHAARNVLAQV